MNGLQEAGIPVHLAGDILPGFTEDYYKYFLGEDDFHPNREAHQLLADFIVDRVRTLDEQEGRETRAGD
jgi:lysophospholipase L1-like esterase